ncbi:hypothetical protein AVKW3434_15835 [Acidovorax sp. SUPP3434]|uniref:hypothetical protein n=1 Tax=Acidovorax sp. SUPP3434 TaxID=2920880 RepID=UPI0023DE3B0D|nr:hypothetical protein [Acidovorax sp. SUPP3434]GKT00878.1 hypothetical protein AVKW3434_15835 [Acidovorax sp. SUPP3434]
MFKKQNFRYFVLCFLMILLAWLFLGLDKYTGDHEMGVSWSPFIKAQPSWIIFFQDPSQDGLEYERYDLLRAEDKARFMEYCKYRRGTLDPYECQKINDASRI